MTINNLVEKSESKFHDQWASQIDIKHVPVEEAFSVPTAVENRYIVSNMGDIDGLQLLDLGCGAGEAGVYFAKKGAKVTVLDVSAGMVETALSLAKLHRVDIIGKVGTTINTGLQSNSIDIVYGGSVLHHVDIGKTMHEIYRILKPGGRAYFIEPLAYNPAINIYRKKADMVRTVDEHPLTSKDFKTIKEIFLNFKHREFWLSALLIFVWYYISGVDPNKERYWKKIICDHQQIDVAFKILNRFDRIILAIFPFLGWLCWNSVIIVKKNV